MNKIFATIALAALAFTSCIKEDNSYKERIPVQPGETIYGLTMNQNTIAMRPASAGMRLAILLAEADRQEEDLSTVDLKTIKSGDVKVQENLFGSLTTITRQGDDYLITYNENAQLPDGLILKGAVLVKTNGAKVLSESSYTSPWEVEMQDLKVLVYSTSGLAQTFNLDSGSTRLYSNSDGSYTIEVSAFRAHIDNLEAYSSWGGSFTLRAEDSSLAYSLCSGKDFKVSGEASGPTVYSSELAQSVGMAYDLTSGIFRGAQIVSGTQECSFTSYLEYDTAQFPASTVRYEWTRDSSSGLPSFRIYYNGYVYPKD